MIADWTPQATGALSIMQILSKNICSTSDLAAPGSVMPVSELKHNSFHQPMNTDLTGNNDSKGCFSSRPKDCEEVNGLLMKQHSLI